MPVRVGWDSRCPRCVLIAINGGWVWEDFQTAMSSAYQLSETSELDKLVYLFDARYAHIFPREIHYKIRHIRIPLHEKAHTILVVGEGTFAQVLIQLLETMTIDSTTQIKQLATLEDAYEDDSLASGDS